MRSFDERAKDAAERKGDGQPTHEEIKAVRRALRSRNRQLNDHLTSIDVFLHLNGHGDPGQGPPMSGTPGNQLVEERFGLVADEIRRIRSAVSGVDFNPADKHAMLDSLSEAALSWDARARTSKLTDLSALRAAQQVATGHDLAAARKAKPLKAYFGDPMEG